MRARSIDFPLVVLMFALALFSAYKVFFDQMDFNTGFNKEFLATINGQVNTVKRKSNGFMSWLDADLGDKLVVNDQIYTYKGSQAEISFKDGSQISLLENTLFQITKKDERTSLSVDKGIMYADLSSENSKLEVTLDGKKFNVEGSNAKIQIAKEKGKDKITILEGELELKGNNQVNLLKKDQVFEYDKKTGKTKIVDLKLIPLLPKVNSFNWYNKVAKVNFKWRKKGSPKEQYLIVSRDRDFKTILNKKEIKSSSSIIKLNEPGGYYWKVNAIDAQGKEVSTGTRNFTLLEEFSPQIISPLSNEVFTFKKTLKRNSPHILPIEWKGNSCSEYIIEWVSPDKKKHQKTTKTLKLYWENPTTGNYSLRVKGKESSRPDTPWSSWVKFEINELDLPPQPILLWPKENFEIALYQKDKSTIRLSWENIPGVQNYVIEINGEAFQVEQSQFLFKPTQTGAYSWRVRAEDEFERDTKWTEMRSLNVQLEVEAGLFPDNGAKIELKKPNQAVQFQWDKSGESSYLFEVSETRDFSEIRVKRNIKTHNTEVVFPKVGTFYWRAKIISPDGKVEYSRPHKVELKKSAQPNIPTINPEQNLEIQIREIPAQTSVFDFFFSRAYAQRFVKFINIEWEEIQDAKSYILEIYSDKNLKKKILTKEIPEANFEWVNPREGTYYYRIAIKDYWDRQTKFSNLSKLNISLADEAKQIASPTQVSPRHRSKFKNDSESITFKWKESSHAIEYKFLVSKSLSFKDIVFQKSTTETELEVETKDLPPKGSYYWRIVAKGKYDQTARSKRRSFSLTQPKKIVKKKKKERRKRFKKKTDRRSIFGVALTPTKVSYELTGTAHTANIDGTAMNSLSVFGKTYINKNWFGEFELNRQSGEVFTTLGFSSMTIKGRALKPFRFGSLPEFNLGAGVSFHNHTSYPLNGSTLGEDSTTAFAATAELQKDFRMGEKFLNQLRVSIGAGSLTALEVGIKTDYFWKKDIAITAGVEMHSYKFETDTAEVSLSELQVGIGIRYYLGSSKRRKRSRYKRKQNYTREKSNK